MSESRQAGLAPGPAPAPDTAIVLDALGVPVVTLDARTRIVSVNAAWRAVNPGLPGDAYASSDDAARECVRAVCEGRAERRELDVSPAADSGNAYTLRAVCVRAEPRLCLVTHLPLAAAVSDQSVSLQAELNTTRQQVLQLQKLESVGRLSNGVAHDFNNLLTSIICFTRFVVDEMVAEDPRRADLIEVLKAADNAARLTNQLLAFSRRKPLQPVTINANDAVTSVARMLRRTLGEHIELVIEPSDETAWVSCDPGQFDQLLFNLALEAKDELDGAEAEGGTIRVRVSRVSTSAGDLPAGDYVEIAFIHQLLPGAAPIESERVPRSSGLGLASCRVIAEQARGALLSHDDADSGGYRVLLPAAEERGGGRRPSLTPLRLRGRVLVVEDQPAILRTMVRALSSTGLEVLQAVNAEDALAVLDAQPDVQIDLVVTDVVLPRMSGPSLVDKLRAKYPALRVLFISGYIGDEVAGSVHTSDSTAFVMKPFSGRQLAVRAAALLEVRTG